MGVAARQEPQPAARRIERDKYVHVYRELKSYHMGAARMEDAKNDLTWSRGLHDCSYLDIGCGCAEMLDFAESIGFTHTAGTELVPQLCEDARVEQMWVHDLGRWPDRSFALVTCFDVIEHLLPDDDQTLIEQMGRIATCRIALTANNRDSIDPTTGNQLHVNKRPYDEWDQIIRSILEPEWTVDRRTDKLYVSETWRATRSCL